MKINLHAFLALALHGGEWSSLHLIIFTFWEKSLLCPFGRRMGGPLSHSGHSGDEKNPYTSAGSQSLPLELIACHDLNLNF
jgi:hypothetical protein